MWIPERHILNFKVTANHLQQMRISYISHLGSVLIMSKTLTEGPDIIGIIVFMPIILMTVFQSKLAYLQNCECI